MTLRNQGLSIACFAILYFLFTSFPLVSATSLPIPSASSIHKHSPWENSNKFTTYHPGQNYKGLSNVKNYFHQLGYIPNKPPSNFNDNFDDNLVSAIQTYQKNYNLSTTGKLDHNTVRQLMTPRCGVPDIINKNTKTSFGNDSTHSLHTVSHYSYFNGQPRWPRGTRQLTYTYPPRLTLNNAAKSTFARAFYRWTQVLNIVFTETSPYQRSNIIIDFLRGDHGDEAGPFDGPLGTWAHAFAPTDGRCHFDADEYWVADGDVRTSPVARAVDLESVAVHEFGHLLGLDHSLDQSAIMYAYINARTRKVDLTPDDIQGVQNLYRYN